MMDNVDISTNAKSVNFERLKQALASFPFLPILRGLPATNAYAVVNLLVTYGISVVEIPLTHPEALECIKLIRREFPHVRLGAGTVMTEHDVYECKNSDVEFCVSPNVNPRVIHAVKNLGMASLPGVQTITEAFLALESGADGLKLFPATAISPETIESMKPVLPPNTFLMPTGKMTPDKIKSYLKVGVDAIGIGSPIYSPKDSLQEIENKLKTFIASYNRDSKEPMHANQTNTQ